MLFSVFTTRIILNIRITARVTELHTEFEFDEPNRTTTLDLELRPGVHEPLYLEAERALERIDRGTDG